MKKPRISPEGHELLRQAVEQYQPQTIKDIQEILIDLFADTIEDIRKTARTPNRPKTGATEATRKR